MSLAGDLERSVLAGAERGVLRFVAAGSVDDGNSTLIGRLLYDSRAILEDQLAALERASLRRGAAGIDLSLLTDGLEAEREQGITIDVAYRYFATPRRKFIIADTPGHEQYTRNMATGASTADALVLLVDARKGVVTQTRRHLVLAQMLGIRRAIAFVNKMDLVGYAQDAYERAVEEMRSFAAPLGFETLEAMPGSALRGDMVAARGGSLGWFTGPTLLERLETLESGAEEAAAGPMRFPVQLVSRPHGGAARGYMGRLESGFLLAGEEVAVYPGGRRTRIRGIRGVAGEREIAVAGDSVTVVLADDLDIGRGDLIADAGAPPREARSLDAMLVWFDAEPLRPGTRLLAQHASRRAPACVSEIVARLDVNTLQERSPDGPASANDILRVRLSLQAPLFVDSYRDVRATGAFILIDEATNRTVGAGMVS